METHIVKITGKSSTNIKSHICFKQHTDSQFCTILKITRIQVAYGRSTWSLDIIRITIDKIIFIGPSIHTYSSSYTAKKNFWWYVLSRYDALSFSVGLKGSLLNMRQKVMMPREKISCLLWNYFMACSTYGGPKGLVNPGQVQSYPTTLEKASPKSMILMVRFGLTRTLLGLRSIWTISLFFKNLNPLVMLANTITLLKNEKLILRVYLKIARGLCFAQQSIRSFPFSGPFSGAQYLTKQAEPTSFKVYKTLFQCLRQLQKPLRGDFSIRYFCSTPISLRQYLQATLTRSRSEVPPVTVVHEGTGWQSLTTISLYRNQFLSLRRTLGWGNRRQSSMLIISSQESLIFSEILSLAGSWAKRRSDEQSSLRPFKMDYLSFSSNFCLSLSYSSLRIRWMWTSMSLTPNSMKLIFRYL